LRADHGHLWAYWHRTFQRRAQRLFGQNLSRGLDTENRESRLISSLSQDCYNERYRHTSDHSVDDGLVRPAMM